MKRITIISLVVALQACAIQSTPKSQPQTEPVNQPQCIGSVELTDELTAKFKSVQDDELLTKALGEPDLGKLCQGQVYQSETKVVLYRAWNSTNPNSRYGQWWALTEPSGLVRDYRKDYEICYQWSPLDKLSQCTLKAGTRVVIGNGQSAKCSDYLTYPVSASQQVFIEDAENAVINCTEYNAVMSWQLE